MRANSTPTLIKVWGWRGAFVKSALLRAMNSIYAWWPVLHVAMLVLILSESVAAIPVADNCFCEFGCFKRDIQTLCCDEICKDASSRNVDEECKRECPNYNNIEVLMNKMGESNSLVLYWRQHYEEYKKKYDTQSENCNSTLAEVRRLRAKLRDMESSGKLISGLATPICLLGALIVVLVVCVCLYQNSEACKKQPKKRDGLEYLGDNDCSCDPSFLALKTSGFDSGSQPRSPNYLVSAGGCLTSDGVVGSKVGRVSSGHSQETTGVILPCVACAASPPISFDQCATRATNQYQQNLTAMCQQPLQQPLQQQQQQQQLQQLPHQQPQQGSYRGSDAAAGSGNNNNHQMLVNQLTAHSNVSNVSNVRQADMAGSGGRKDQARKNEKNSKTQNDPESCAFRMADLDFAPNYYYQESKCQQSHKRTKNNNGNGNDISS